MGWATEFQFLPETMKGLFSSSPRPDRHWGPKSLLTNGYGELFPWQ